MRQSYLFHSLCLCYVLDGIDLDFCNTSSTRNLAGNVSDTDNEAFQCEGRCDFEFQIKITFISSLRFILIGKIATRVSCDLKREIEKRKKTIIRIMSFHRF